MQPPYYICFVFMSGWDAFTGNHPQDYRYSYRFANFQFSSACQSRTSWSGSTAHIMVWEVPEPPLSREGCICANVRYILHSWIPDSHGTEMHIPARQILCAFECWQTGNLIGSCVRTYTCNLPCEKNSATTFHDSPLALSDPTLQPCGSAHLKPP